MKRISLFAMAVALGMTLAQCKKTETPTNENEGGKVHITLDVSSGAKVIISPETGGTAFEQGDEVLVANGGHYVGTLTYNKSLRKFDGNLDAGLDESDYLHFYLLGNKDTEENLDDTENRPTTLTVNISDQTAAYPEIAYAHSTDTYTEGVTAYKARLLNKCALVKFTTNSISTSKAVTITGMNNKVAVDLSDNSFEYSKVGDGAISLHAESRTERWGILLPQSQVSDATATAVGYATTPAFTVPEIEANGYLDAGIAVTLVETYPEGAINGKFTIDETGTQVFFAQGNLQYIGSAAEPYWRFAEHQWDYFGNPTDQMSNSETVDRDYFGWGTSGYNHNAAAYQPWETNENNGYYYAYKDQFKNLFDGNGQADWGYNAISNGGNTENLWRTLKREEWKWLLGPTNNPNPGTNCRTSSTVNGTANARYTNATINTDGISVNGIIVFPDDYTLGTPDGVTWGSINQKSDWGTKCTTAGWTSLETAGCVFLPAAGYRTGSASNYVGTGGFYWSSSYNNGDYSYHLVYRNGYDFVNPENTSPRNNGFSVRLVCDVE